MPTPHHHASSLQTRPKCPAPPLGYRLAGPEKGPLWATQIPILKLQFRVNQIRKGNLLLALHFPALHDLGSNIQVTG